MYTYYGDPVPNHEIKIRHYGNLGSNCQIKFPPILLAIQYAIYNHVCVFVEKELSHLLLQQANSAISPTSLVKSTHYKFLKAYKKLCTASFLTYKPGV